MNDAIGVSISDRIGNIDKVSYQLSKLVYAIRSMFVVGSCRPVQAIMEFMDGHRQGARTTLSDQTHGIEVFPLSIYPSGVDRDNARMFQPCGQICFGMEATYHKRVVSEFRTNFLDRNLAIAIVVIREVNHPHPTGSQCFDD